MTKTTNNVVSYRGQIKFTDTDVINLDDWIPAGEYNPHNVRPFLLHDHGFVLCVVFADCLSDALDIAADEGKFDRYLIDLNNPSHRDDYLVRDIVTPGSDPNCPEYIDKEGNKYWWKEEKEPAFLGNAGEPFDLESIGVEELANPPRSFCAQYNAIVGR